MRIAAGIGTEAVGLPLHPRAVAEQAVAAEESGYGSVWCVHFSRGIDSLSMLAAAAVRTRLVTLAVGVVPTYPRHPLALAQQAATVQALSGGRLVLGIGVSHRPVIEEMHGLGYERPAAHLREYLSVLVPVLETGRVRFEGEFYRVEGEVTVPGTSPVPVLVGALSPAMVRVAGACAHGVVTWLAGPALLEARIVPDVGKAAADAGRPAPRVIAAVPVAVTGDREAGREAANTVLARYGGLANYQRVLARQEAGTPADLAVFGDEAAIRRGLQRLADAGATEVWPMPFPVGEAAPSLARTRRVLDELAVQEHHRPRKEQDHADQG